MTEMRTYIYKGPVMEFNNLIMENWTGETVAPSEKKARCNLAYQFKTQHKRLPSAKITLPGICTIVS